ncbi:hypothetical protein [Comamonas thiooxydans]|uniref:hypothetical protein n=1 Tax=Comamonas thiooxydans TaxID=363952 RepID=UPI0001BB173B|nr:hypothetical protein [Comamonas thiooxydans]ACY33735.1 conserved hypothetical protein [Comamonas thiooxydans]MDO1474042.1 hypothetical protein [Comamonas thiooxydans]
MKSTANRRLDAVADKLGHDVDNRVEAIFISALVPDEAKADGYTERNCIGLLSMRRSEPIRIVRKPSESVAEMDARAKSYPKDNPLSVAMWFRVHKGDASDLAKFEVAREVQG